MTPGNVSVPSATSTSTAAPAAPVAVEAGPADFMQMLAQMVGAPTAASAAVAQATFTIPVEETTAELPDAEDVVGLLSVSLPVTSFDPPEIPAAARSFGIAGPAGVDTKRGLALAAELQPFTELTSATESAEDISGGALESLHVQAGATEKPNTLQSLVAHAAISRPVHTPVGSSAWADEIGTRVMMMAEQGRQTASLRLSPEQLGPLEINITIQDDRASVWFGAAHADTRSAIEHALPRLRELFESQGMSLTDAGVYKDSPREHATPQILHSGTGAEVASGEGDSAAVSAVRRGLVDAYA